MKPKTAAMQAQEEPDAPAVRSYTTMVMHNNQQFRLILRTPEAQQRIARKTRIRRIAITCVLAVAILAPGPFVDLPHSNPICTFTHLC